jgi:hypothetical protein
MIAGGKPGSLCSGGQVGEGMSVARNAAPMSSSTMKDESSSYT